MSRKPKKPYRAPVVSPPASDAPPASTPTLEPRPKRVRPVEPLSAREVAAAAKKAARARLLNRA